MRLTLLILASFAIQWTTQPGVQYVVERRADSVSFSPVIRYAVGDSSGPYIEIPADLQEIFEGVAKEYKFILLRITPWQGSSADMPLWQPVDTFTGEFSTIPAITGVSYYAGRAVKGVVRSTVISTLYLDFAPDDVSTVDIKSANTWEGDTLVYVKTRMQSKWWHCAYSFKGGKPVAVECECEFDYNRSGKVELSDLVTFGAGYFAGAYNLSDFASFGEVYQKASKVNWRA
jgi:hypothetical protein